MKIRKALNELEEYLAERIEHGDQYHNVDLTDAIRLMLDLGEAALDQLDEGVIATLETEEWRPNKGDLSQYFESNGTRCIHCGSERLEYYGPRDDETGHIPITCRACYANWSEKMELVGIVWNGETMMKPRDGSNARMVLDDMVIVARAGVKRVYINAFPAKDGVLATGDTRYHQTEIPYFRPAEDEDGDDEKIS